MATTYLDGLEFTLQPNTGLGRRSVTVQVESNTPGLSPREANLKITQKGRPLTLEPTVAEHTGGGTIVKQSDPEGGNPGIYLLDHGYGAAGGSYTLDMTSNTNWYWYWNTDKGEDVHQANMDLVAQGWTATPADRVSTTDHPNDGHADHTWPGVASFTVPDFDRGGTAFDEAKKDQAQPDVPLGGERTVVRELRNVHPELTADDMEENARQLHIRRELPAHTHIIEWPWDDMTSLNWAMENNKYDDKMFRFGTNATGTLTLTTGFDLSEQSQLNREKQYTSAQGYKLFETTFSDLPRIALTPDSENDDPVFYKLRFTGRTANAEETANENVDEARIYYTGTQMNVPLRNMKTGQYYLSSGAHTLKLDFSNSYFNRVKVRVKAVLVNTDATQDGVDDYLAVLNNPDPALAKEKLLYPTSNWDKGVEFLSDGSSKTIEVPLAENNHKNMMYKVVVEYCRHKGGGVYDEGNWLEIADTKIYQDGKPCDGSNVIWKYSAQDWGWSQLGNLKTLGGVPESNLDLIGAENVKWSYPTPLAADQATFKNWQTSFKACLDSKALSSIIVGPNDITGRRATLRTLQNFEFMFAYTRGWAYRPSGNQRYPIYWRRVAPFQATSSSGNPTVTPNFRMLIKSTQTSHEGFIGVKPGESGYPNIYSSCECWVGETLIFSYGPAGWPATINNNRPVDYQHVIFQPESLGHRYIHILKTYSDVEKCGIQNPSGNSTLSFWAEAYNNNINPLISEMGKFVKEADIAGILYNNIARGYAEIYDDRLISNTNKPNTAVCRTSIELNTTSDLHPQE